jgi:ADP-ribosylglycohydrolase
MSALGRGGHGTPEQRINDSKGCGGVMRSAPAGFLGIFGWTRAQAFDLGARTGAITHGHPTGFIASGALSAVIHELFEGADLRIAVETVVIDMDDMTESGETRGALAAALTLSNDADVSPPDAVRQLGQGWIAEEALAIGVYSALVAETYVQAIRIAANHDGDSDSTASIAGQLWGARAGVTDIPHDWVNQLDVGAAVMRSCKEFLALGESLE